MVMNKEQIKEVIPHREPFLLIDEIVDLQIGKSAKAVKYVSEDEYYFEGHFPQEKVMPGVLIVEALAQAGAVSLMSMPENKGKLGLLGGIKDAKFRQKVVPGDKLELEIIFTRLRSRAGTGIATAHVDGKLACKCEIMFIFN